MSAKRLPSKRFKREFEALVQRAKGIGLKAFYIEHDEGGVSIGFAYKFSLDGVFNPRSEESEPILTEKGLPTIKEAHLWLDGYNAYRSTAHKRPESLAKFYEVAQDDEAVERVLAKATRGDGDAWVEGNYFAGLKDGIEWLTGVNDNEPLESHPDPREEANANA